MTLTKISYSESRKLTTDKKFESRLVSFSAEAQIVDGEDVTEQVQRLKTFVKKELESAIKNE